MNSEDTFAAMLGLVPNKDVNNTILMGIDSFIEAVKDNIISDHCGYGFWATETHYQPGPRYTCDKNGYIIGGQNTGINLLNLINGVEKSPHWATHILWIIWR